MTSFASRLAPTGECIPNVGASLLAKASVQPAYVHQAETKMPGAMPGILCSSSAAQRRIRMAVSYPLAGSCRRSCCPFFPGCWLRSCARRR
ncbi:hypothetical protein DMX04_13405 [Pseudomonas koreensis]|nr:hypothetical protein DMX04_13405 [Pseudomonas koreensis]